MSVHQSHQSELDKFKEVLKKSTLKVSFELETPEGASTISDIDLYKMLTPGVQDTDVNKQLYEYIYAIFSETVTGTEDYKFTQLEKEIVESPVAKKCYNIAVAKYLENTASAISNREEYYRALQLYYRCLMTRAKILGLEASTDSNPDIDEVIGTGTVKDDKTIYAEQQTNLVIGAFNITLRKNHYNFPNEFLESDFINIMKFQKKLLNSSKNSDGVIGGSIIDIEALVASINNLHQLYRSDLESDKDNREIIEKKMGKL
jgi:hypothetical protein